MKIGIVTIEQCNNYGAELQAYALQRKLQLMSYDAENINYYFYKHPKHKRTHGARPIFKLSLKNRIKEFLFPILDWLKSLKNRAATRTRQERFETFVREQVKHSREYCTIEELFQNPPQYDVYMTGSDQVWNPRAGASLSPYFLAFAPHGAKCVSYAASFGVASLTDQESQIMANYLKRYKAIGVREAKGVELVSRMDGVPSAVHVLDPTLLLDAHEWSTVAQLVRTNNKPYLLVYDLAGSQELWELAHRIAKEQGLKIHCIGEEGPAEFVGCFAHASVIVTNSFHGTAFSVNFARPFYVVKPRGMTNASRIESLLDALDLRSRFWNYDEVDKVSLAKDIDWTVVHTKLAALREKSITFLKESLA